MLLSGQQGPLLYVTTAKIADVADSQERKFGTDVVEIQSAR